MVEDPPRLGVKDLGKINPENRMLIQGAGDGSWERVCHTILDLDEERRGGYALDGDMEMAGLMLDEGVNCLRYAWAVRANRRWITLGDLPDQALHALFLNPRIQHHIERQFDPTGVWFVEHQPLGRHGPDHDGVVERTRRDIIASKIFTPRELLWSDVRVGSPICWGQ